MRRVHKPSTLQRCFRNGATSDPHPCACREAAAKLTANREVIVRDCTSRSGVFTDSTGVNGECYILLHDRPRVTGGQFSSLPCEQWLSTVLYCRLPTKAGAGDCGRSRLRAATHGRLAADGVHHHCSGCYKRCMCPHLIGSPWACPATCPLPTAVLHASEVNVHCSAVVSRATVAPSTRQHTGGQSAQRPSHTSGIEPPPRETCPQPRRQRCGGPAMPCCKTPTEHHTQRLSFGLAHPMA